MAVKVIVKVQPEKERTGKPAQQLIAPPRLRKQRENIIIRTLKVMLMDIRMRFNSRLRKDYGDYARFCELSRGNR